MTENKRFTVEKIELVSDHLSTRFFIKDNLEESCYDVRHMISQGYEVQFDTWAENIADKWNELVQENEDLKKEIALLKVELDTHKHPLWSTREAERIINELKDENEMLNKKLHEISWNQYVNGGW